ncbi:MAG TPA: nicotinamide mononucleotide transporter [Verrucomicrobiae bacterium]|nr:nicotinamide mononucleotide transporter [Verrucomicrobiae bacterium]
MLEQLIKFKGADWVGMVFGLISTYLLAKGKRVGFVVGVVGGLGWVTFGILTGSIAGILANICFIGFNCHGYFCWKKKQEQAKAEPGKGKSDSDVVMEKTA